MDEFDIIARYFAPLATYPGAFGLTDDAAAISPRAGFDLVVTTDAIAQGTDFFAHDPPDAIAKKALRVNLSDLAAKGARPFGYLVNLTLPHADGTWLEAFAGALAADQREFHLSLLGGDTGRGDLAIAITAFGHVPQGKMIRRAGARAGDMVFVTGQIGDSGGGLALFKREKHALRETERDYLIARYRVPRPPVSFGAGLCGLASAAVDVSDGLLADLGHLAAASGVRLEIEAQIIPRSEALRAFWGDGTEAILRAAAAGDDYQIAFSADPQHEKEITRAALDTGTMLTCIGRAVPGQGVVVRHQGRELPGAAPGYRHF